MLSRAASLSLIKRTSKIITTSNYRSFCEVQCGTFASLKSRPLLLSHSSDRAYSKKFDDQGKPNAPKSKKEIDFKEEKESEKTKAEREHRANLEGLVTEKHISDLEDQLKGVEENVQKTIDKSSQERKEKTEGKKDHEEKNQLEKKSDKENENNVRQIVHGEELHKQALAEDEEAEDGMEEDMEEGMEELEEDAEIMEEQEHLKQELSGSRNLPAIFLAATSAGGNVPSLQNVPEEFPNVICIPVTRRPLIPRFYKTLHIKNPKVIQAVQQAINRGEPYIGVFLAKDDDNPSVQNDIVENLNEIYPIGTFAKIDSVVPPSPLIQESGMTFIVQPIRRIVATELLTTPTKKPDTKDTLSKSDKDSGKTKPERRSLLGYTRVATQNFKDEPYDKKDRVVRALTQEIYMTLSDIAKINKFFKEHIADYNTFSSVIFEDAGALADFVAVLITAEPHELQSVMDSRKVVDRLKAALVLLKKEFVAAQLQHSISTDIRLKFEERQKQAFLHEQLKIIKKELGLEADAKDKVIEELKLKAAKYAMPEHVKKIFDEELAKLGMLESVGSEFNITRNYIDWLASIPWGHRTLDLLDVEHAREILAEDHYGMEDVKDRIVEFIAVSKLRGSLSQGKIICLVGPPGVGKTSVGKSIARTLGRKYYRFSVGGLSDVHEIKGHRRTYVGALPGKIVHAMKQCATENPLILIDEIDKIGESRRVTGGDPAAALLELLDPEQNVTFMDDYLDVPLDLSKVLFVCTANTLDTIPGPLLDRMEVIELSGYIAEEKFAIAQQYLIPQAMRDSGLPKNSVLIQEKILLELIKFYCREAGVRNLKKSIEKILRKAAVTLVKDQKLPIVTDKLILPANEQVNEAINETKEKFEDKGKLSDPSNNWQKKGSEKDPTEVFQSDLFVKDPLIVVDKEQLVKYVGKPTYSSEKLFESTPPGVAMGLSVSGLGGAALYLEAIADPSYIASSSSREAAAQGRLIQTGNLGKVMEESISIAYSVAKKFLYQYEKNNKEDEDTFDKKPVSFFANNLIHLHAPEGAIMKDGPSAGITLTTCLLSLAMNCPVRPNVAMTGELTLSGKVLRIGGLKEKTIAAKREGVKDILFPKSNLADWEEIPDHIKDGMIPHPVGSYQEVFDVCFPKDD